MDYLMEHAALCRNFFINCDGHQDHQQIRLAEFTRGHWDSGSKTAFYAAESKPTHPTGKQFGSVIEVRCPQCERWMKATELRFYDRLRAEQRRMRHAGEAIPLLNMSAVIYLRQLAPSLAYI